MEPTKTQMQPLTPSIYVASAAAEPACLLPWDSEFFGTRIAKARAPSLNNEFITRLLSWCDSERIDCLYFLATAEDADTIRLAEDNGFRFMDIRMTLGRRLHDDIVPSEGIRTVQPSDIPHMKRLAGKSFVNTRFYKDPHFSKQKCDELYSTWLERSCDGYADCVLVADRQGQPVGFITCSLGQLEGVIGLLAVDQHFQGCGIGQALVFAALRYFYENGMKGATVVTQGCNVSSQRLYQRCGFVTELVQIWYHLWCTALGLSGGRMNSKGN